MAPARLKKGDLVRVCHDQTYNGEGEAYTRLPQGYSLLSQAERQYWRNVGTLTLSQMLRLYQGMPSKHQRITHLRVHPEPGDLVTVVTPRDRRHAPTRDGVFVIVSCPRLGREYHINRSYLESIPESS